MVKLEIFTVIIKSDCMPPDDIPSAQRHHSDLILASWAYLPISAADSHIIKVQAPALGSELSQCQGCTAWRIDFVSVVHLYDLDIKILKCSRNLLYKLLEQCDTRRHVGSVEYRHFFGCFLQEVLLMLCKAGGCNHQRCRILQCRLKQALCRFRRREVYHDIHCIKQCGHTVGDQYIFGQIALEFIIDMYSCQRQFAVMQQTVNKKIAYSAGTSDDSYFFCHSYDCS